ncbi:expressed unknown protein [Seminavis robusta]|uniref:Uncharacterized protein n=1 Tax=Seminavis robusta TaxID=568900 RepID=A0A9N8EKW6_9STRA|nr:expressed unknown protein [Seminavis robusta]|eukprot:Sro1252_g256300.1 n/a (529) ;mRNA; r:25921-27623
MNEKTGELTVTTSSGSPSLSTRSSSLSRKAQKRSSSERPSASATNDHGMDVVDHRQRSVLSHPLGLSLLSAFQKGLTEIIVSKVDAASARLGYHALPEVNVRAEAHEKPRGFIGILLTNTGSKEEAYKSTPYAAVAFGLKTEDWWRKLDQNAKYLNLMRDWKESKNPKFDRPLLFAVVTIKEQTDGSKEKTSVRGEAKVEFRIGVFLCSPHDKIKYRMTLIWHAASDNLGKASKFFGKLLRVTSSFQQWRDKDGSLPAYQYLSSNCCKITDCVLRCYDNRLQRTNRSYDIYLDEKCKEIVGETTEVLSWQKAMDPESIGDEHDPFWQNERSFGKQPALQVLSIPYRKGRHYAKKLSDFLPVVDKLEKLHKCGYVHGDIRAFNVVFGDDKDEGWLIDFDYGGKVGDVKYPSGYKKALADGDRIGEQEEPIKVWHDWHALATLMFQIHQPAETDRKSNKDALDNLQRVQLVWLNRDEDPSETNIAELKTSIEEFDVPLKPSLIFKLELDRVKEEGTLHWATGSPAKKPGP